MTKGNEHPSTYPEWYWVHGLHDAFIRQMEAYEFPFDYTKFVEEKSRYNRNCLTFKIEAGGAMFDTSVKEIRFYNYKLLPDSIPLQGGKEVCWVADRLADHGNFYTLEIDLRDFRSGPRKILTMKIKFDRAEVDR